MSVAELLAEIDRMSPSEKHEVRRHLIDVKTDSTSDSGCYLEERDGLLMLITPQIIRQADIDKILEDFP